MLFSFDHDIKNSKSLSTSKTGGKGKKTCPTTVSSKGDPWINMTATCVNSYRTVSLIIQK